MRLTGILMCLCLGIALLLGAGNHARASSSDVVDLPDLTFESREPVGTTAFYRISLKVPAGSAALIGPRHIAGFVAVLRNRHCTDLMTPHFGSEGMYAMRDLILAAAKRFFPEIGVSDVYFREMRWEGGTCERGQPLTVACNGTWLKL